MKLALTLAAGLLAASSMAFAADNNGGKDGMTNDQDKTGSITDKNRPDMDDQKACKDGTSGGAVCQEPGTEIQK